MRYTEINSPLFQHMDYGHLQELKTGKGREKKKKKRGKKEKKKKEKKKDELIFN